MKSFLKFLLLPIAGLALAATSATAANWPPAAGDLILGVQAAAGTGSNTNVFFNLGPAHVIRDNPSPGTVVNLDAELQAAFGASWATRTDLYFGVIGVRTNNPPIGFGLGSVAPVNGDPGRTIYASKGTATAGSANPWSFNAPGLAGPAGIVLGQYTALATINTNGNQVMTMVRESHPTQWNNGWTIYNPIAGAGYTSFASGIQARMTSGGAIVDLFRILGTSGASSYVTSVTLATSGDVTVSRAGAASKYFTVTTNATNGTIAGGGTDILHAAGSYARLVGTPAAGYGFDRWIGAPVGSPNPLNLLVDKNKIVSTKFGLFPAISLPTATGLTGVSAILGANVTSTGGGVAKERGIIFADETVNANPLLNGASVTKVTKVGGRGIFSIPVTGLTAGKTYVFKGFITTNIGTSYTDLGYFTTDTTVTFTGNVGTVTNRAIRAGKSQLFEFNMPKSSLAAFSTTGASASMAWELQVAKFDARGRKFWASLGTGTGNVAFNSPLTNGDFRVRLTNGGASTETVTLNLDGSSLSDPKPDVSVGFTALAGEGANEYAPTVQFLSANTREAKPVDFFFLLGNDGPVPDAMKVTATVGNRGDLFRTIYKVGIKNVTASILLGKYSTPVLSSTDAPVSMSVKIYPNRADTRILEKRSVGGRIRSFYGAETFNALVRIAPASDPTITDQVNYRLNTLAN